MNDTRIVKPAARVALGGALVFAGVSHLTFGRKAFQAQVPDFVPLDKDRTVVYSGVVEILLGGSLILVNRQHEAAIGKIAAAFFVAVFPGNLHQWWHRTSAFGLDTDGKRFLRLFFQPILIAWALLSTHRRN